MGRRSQWYHRSLRTLPTLFSIIIFALTMCIFHVSSRKQFRVQESITTLEQSNGNVLKRCLQPIYFPANGNAQVRLNSEQPQVSIISTVIGRDAKYTDTWAIDICEQKDRERFQVLALTLSMDVSRYIEQAFTQNTRCRKAIHDGLLVEIVQVGSDPGLYESWDILIQEFASADYIMNWNIDDRKKVNCILEKLKLIQKHHADVISSAVAVTTTPGESYEEYMNRLSAKQQEYWFTDKRGILNLADFVKTDPHTKRMLREVDNPPHNSPLWRKAIHSKVGTFAEQVPHRNNQAAPSCSDWTFWVNVCRNGFKILHSDHAFELYAKRDQSHNRLDIGGHIHCLDYTLAALQPFGLFNNQHFQNYPRAFKKPRVTVIHEQELTTVQGADRRMRQIVSWLKWNNFIVTVIVRGQHWVHAGSKESEAFLENLGIEQIVDDLSLSTLRNSMQSHDTADVYMMSLWFWREFDRSNLDGKGGTDYTIPELLLPDIKNTATTILLVDDVHSNRCRQNPDCEIFDHIRDVESNVIGQSSLTVTLTEKDRQVYGELSPNGKFVTLPYVIQKRGLLAKEPSKSNRKRMLFVGSTNENNHRAAQFLVQTVFPLVRHQIDASLTLVGAYAWKQLVYDMSQGENQYRIGSVQKLARTPSDPKSLKGDFFLSSCTASAQLDDEYVVQSRFCDNPILNAFDTVVELDSFLADSDVILAPTTISGSGISTKVFLGLEAGRPVVTTEDGLTATRCTDRTCPTRCGNIFVACGDPESFVNQTLAALQANYERDNNEAPQFVDWLQDSWLESLLVGLKE